MRSAGLAWGLVLFMLAGGIYSIAIDQAWLGGSIWAFTALFLLPPLQNFCSDFLNMEIPEPLSLLVFVLGFLSGLLLM